jgi:hypothetical protein
MTGSHQSTGAARTWPGTGMTVVTLVALTGCTAPAVTAATRDAARATIDPIVAARLPGVPLKPATDCIIDNATAAEIVTVATEPGGTAARTVSTVIRRPETLECLAADGLPALLNTL